MHVALEAVRLYIYIYTREPWQNKANVLPVGKWRNFPRVRLNDRARLLDAEFSARPRIQSRARV